MCESLLLKMLLLLQSSSSLRSQLDFGESYAQSSLPLCYPTSLTFLQDFLSGTISLVQIFNQGQVLGNPT